MDAERLWNVIEDPRKVVVLGIGIILLVTIPFAALAPDEPQYPEKPETLTNENVVGYVSAYERSEVYREREPPEDADLTLDCPAALDRVTEVGYYVTVMCWGSSSASDGSSFAEERSFYLVDEVSTTRIHTEDGPYDAGAEARGTFYLVNFDRPNYSIGVEVRPADAGNAGSEFDHTYDVTGVSGIGQTKVVPPGRYVVVATLESNERAEFVWNVTEDPARRPVPAFYVTPDGELVVSPVPEPRPESPEIY